MAGRHRQRSFFAKCAQRLLPETKMPARSTVAIHRPDHLLLPRPGGTVINPQPATTTFDADRSPVRVDFAETSLESRYRPCRRDRGENAIRMFEREEHEIIRRNRVKNRIHPGLHAHDGRTN